MDQLTLNEDFNSKLTEKGQIRFYNMTVAFKEIEARFESALPYLVTDTMIGGNNRNTDIINVKNNIKNESSYNQFQANTSFYQGFTGIATLASSLPLPLAESSNKLKEVANSISSSLGQYKGKYERGIKDLEKQKKALSEKIKGIEQEKNEIKDSWESLEEEINKKEKELATQYTNLQSTFNENQTDRQQKFNKLIEDLGTKGDQELKNLESDFNDERKELFKKWEEDLIGFYNEKKAKFEEFEREVYQGSDAALTYLKKQQDASAIVANNVATNQIAGHFAKEAKAKTVAVRIWRGATLASFIVTVIVGYFLLINQGNANTTVLSATELISRLVVTGALGSLTAYLARLATNDEKSRKYNSSMEIRLRTLNPYIDTFDIDQQSELKKELFPIIFRETEKEYQKEKKKEEVEEEK